jgi:hypothetical protein
MMREDIYDHLAQVYLGKRKEVDEKKKRQFNAWFSINITIAAIILASSFYGLTAFLTHKSSFLKKQVIYTLNNGTISFDYNFKNSLSPTQTFVLSIPPMDAKKYHDLAFAIRARDEKTPGIIKVVFRNKRNEISSYYIQGVGNSWKNVEILLSEFKQISDWSSLVDVSFVVESWNVDGEIGTILIDDVHFSS